MVYDPGIRRQIDEYATSEIRDKMRRAYLSRGRSRLIGHNFLFLAQIKLNGMLLFFEELGLLLRLPKFRLINLSYL